MSKQAKRKITVEVSSKSSEQQPKSRPSVFERLGTKATGSGASSEFCRHWVQNGTCVYGKTCKYASTHTLTSPSKQRAAKKDENKKRSHSAGKDDPNKRLHSTVVKALPLRSPDHEWEQWDQTDLEDADAEVLEKRRQELQRELEIQMKMESKLTKKKDKKIKKGSSSSSTNNSSSSTTESSSSSEESSTTSSSTSLESRRRKTKRSKSTKRESSTSTEPERRRKKNNSKTSHKHSSSNPHPTKSSTNIIDSSRLKKTISPAVKTSSKPVKSPSPLRPSASRRFSQTPPPPPKSSKNIASLKSGPNTKPVARSPRPISSSDRKEKHRTPSPKVSSRDREREREREKEKEREREREREKEKEREREQREKEQREREKEREKEKAREREKEREQREREHAKSKQATSSSSSKSPKRDSRSARDILKKKDSPDSLHSRDRNIKSSPNRSRSANTSSSSANKREAGNKNSPAISTTSNKDDRKNDRKKDDRERRDPKDRSIERRKDNNKRVHDDSRDKDRNDRDAERNRDRERDRRLTREEREAAREKEREEALARCQERQRERERLKELAKKEREIPSLLHINTSRGREARDNRDRSRDRGLDKPPPDRVERLLPLPADRVPPIRKELERQAARSQDRSSNRSSDRDRDRSDRNRSTTRNTERSLERRDRMDRDGERLETSRDRERERGGPIDRPDNRNNYEHRNYDRGSSVQRFNREHERDNRPEREYPITGHARDERRIEEKNYESPYDNRSGRRDDPRYLEMEHEYSDNPRDDRRLPLDAREYPDDRRSRREAWGEPREIDPDIVLEEDRRRGYIRDESRPPQNAKGREWDNPEYHNRGDWGEPNNRRPHDWDGHREDWEQGDRTSIDEEWRHYNRSMDSWPSEDNRRRWPQEFGDRQGRGGPKSTSSHRDDEEIRRPPLEAKPPVEHISAEPVVLEEGKKEPALGKRTSEPSDDAPEIKKPCIVEEPAVLEDALSEISDDADEILNREDEIADPAPDPPEDEKRIPNPVVPLSETEPEHKNQSPAPESHESALDEDGIDNMDFEEISDEELEEEVKVKGLGDALGVDWASLVTESRPRVKSEKTGSAKGRWEYHKVLTRIGISLEMAGEELVKEILHLDKGSDEKIKIEPPELSHPIAGIQVSTNEGKTIRNNLFSSAGSFRRALSARRDLSIRRHLSKLPINEVFIERPKTPDPELFKLAMQLAKACKN